MDKFIKGYLDRSHEIIGERTPEEVAHDNEVIKQLRKGRDIKNALKMAAQMYPAEALHWDEGAIGDIAAHYEYLMEHEEIKETVWLGGLQINQALRETTEPQRVR